MSVLVRAVAALLACFAVAASAKDAASGQFEIVTLSNRADLISGGDALVEVRVPKGVALNRSGESQAVLRCDPNLVERILLNLLDNAIAVAPDESVVDIHAERQAEASFLVRVGNRGRVIPADVLPTLFRKYRQGGEQLSLKRFGGWGLGLTFCRLAVERHGGTIRARSPYVDGEGAAFEFTLPADPR